MPPTPAPSSTRSSSPAKPPPEVCYCPGALRELHWATEELIKARTQLQQADPARHLIEETRLARQELEAARRRLEAISRSPELDARASVILERLEQAIPAAEYLTDLVDKLQAAEVIAWRR